MLPPSPRGAGSSRPRSWLPVLILLIGLFVACQATATAPLAPCGTVAAMACGIMDYWSKMLTIDLATNDSAQYIYSDCGEYILSAPGYFNSSTGQQWVFDGGFNASYSLNISDGEQSFYNFEAPYKYFYWDSTVAGYDAVKDLFYLAGPVEGNSSLVNDPVTLYASTVQQLTWEPVLTFTPPTPIVNANHYWARAAQITLDATELIAVSSLWQSGRVLETANVSVYEFASQSWSQWHTVQIPNGYVYDSNLPLYVQANGNLLGFFNDNPFNYASMKAVSFNVPAGSVASIRNVTCLPAAGMDQISYTSQQQLVPGVILRASDNASPPNLLSMCLLDINSLSVVCVNISVFFSFPPHLLTNLFPCAALNGQSMCHHRRARLRVAPIQLRMALVTGTLCGLPWAVNYRRVLSFASQRLTKR